MPASAAQIAANRRNAQRSGGPKSEQGKQRSRENAVTHGLRAEQLVSSADLLRLKTREDMFRHDLKPQTYTDYHLIRRIALAAVRLERCEAAEDAALEGAARDALDAWETKRRKQIRRRAQDLRQDPEEVVADLHASAFGIDWLVRHWKALRLDLLAGECWDEEQTRHALRLCGIEPRIARLDANGQAISRAANLLRESTDDDVARLFLLNLAEGRIARLLAARPEAEAKVEAVLRQQVLRGALVDTRPEAILRQRYEREADLLLHRSLKALHKLKAEQEAAPRREQRIWTDSPPASVIDIAATPAPNEPNLEEEDEDEDRRIVLAEKRLVRLMAKARRILERRTEPDTEAHEDGSEGDDLGDEWAASPLEWAEESANHAGKEPGASRIVQEVA